MENKPKPKRKLHPANRLQKKKKKSTIEELPEM